MPLFLLSLLGFGRTIFGTIFAWLSRRSLSEIICIALALLALVQFVGLRAEKRHSAKLQAQVVNCSRQRHADQAAYTKAQADAQAKNKVQVAKVEQQYQRNSDNEKDAYERDLAQLRAERLRQRTAPAQSAPRTAGSSPNSAPGPATDGHGVQVPQTADVQAEDAAEIELRLMHLQNYVAGLLAIDPNKP